MANMEQIEFGPVLQIRARQGESCDWRPEAADVNATADGTHVYFESCEASKCVSVAATCGDETSRGRVLDVNLTMRGVCPGRRSSVGVHLSEVDENGMEHARGFRAVAIPAQNAGARCDVALSALRFILPEDMSVARHGRRRHFIVRTTHHYLDEDCGACSTAD